MKFSTRTEYGLRALTSLAKIYPRSLSLAKIAMDNHLSKAYLERLFAALKKIKVIKSIKGKYGGYQLSQKPAQVRLDRVVKALEGSTAPYACVESNLGCPVCSLRKVWLKLDKSISGTLASTSLHDLT